MFELFRRKKPDQDPYEHTAWDQLFREKPGIDILARMDVPGRGLVATGRILNGDVYVGDVLSNRYRAMFTVKEIECLEGAGGAMPEQRLVQAARAGENVALTLEGGTLEQLERSQELLRLDR